METGMVNHLLHNITQLRVKSPGRFIDTVSCQLAKQPAPSTSWKRALQIRLTDPSLRKSTAEQKSLFGSGNIDF